MSVAPCKYCFIHTPKCHDQYEFYADWKEKETHRKEMIHNRKFQGNMLRSVKRDACEKQRRRHKR